MSDSMTASILGALIGSLVGGLVSWWVARIYYVRAARDLRDESDRLRRVTLQVLSGLEEAGLVSIGRDVSGAPTGGIVKQGQVKMRV
jgi:membrane protein YqaA with SNARE-associated domain